METLENDFISIKIASKGAELNSLYHKHSQKEYLWQADNKWWPRHAPILFPIVGKLNNNQYKHKGISYSLPQHGFARDMNFELLNNGTEIICTLESNKETRLLYPFDFELTITYKLQDSCLIISWNVVNTGSENLLFSIGAHPGFICPLNQNESFDDYYLEFETEETLERHLLENGCLNGKTEPVLSQSKYLNLDYRLFAKDAIVLKEIKSSFIYLKSHKSDYYLKFNSPDFPFFGIWTKPGASFICLEPWCGIADNKDFSGELQDKEGIVSLEPNSVFKKWYSIEL